MNGFGCIFHAIQSLGDQFIRANHLEARAVQKIVDRGIKASHVAAHKLGGMVHIAENVAHLRT